MLIYPTGRPFFLLFTTVGMPQAYTPPTNVWTELLYGHFLYTASATVGTRAPIFEVLDSANRQYAVGDCGVNVTAGQTVAFTLNSNGLRSGSAGVATNFIPIPPNLIIPPGGLVRIRDNAAIDSAGDLANLRLCVAQSSMTKVQ